MGAMLDASGKRDSLVKPYQSHKHARTGELRPRSRNPDQNNMSASVLLLNALLDCVDNVHVDFSRFSDTNWLHHSGRWEQHHLQGAKSDNHGGRHGRLNHQSKLAALKALQLLVSLCCLCAQLFYLA
jgi:hypothetical protein